jgi:WD40 repeat protein
MRSKEFRFSIRFYRAHVPRLLATCSADKTIKIWKQDINNNAYLAHPTGSTVRGLPPTQPKGSSLRNVGSPFDFKLLKTLQGHQRWVWDCCFSADSAYLLSASSDNHCRLWDLNLGDSIQQYVGHQKAVSCVALAD